MEYEDHVFLSPKESEHLNRSYAEELDQISLVSKTNPTTGKQSLVLAAVQEGSLAAKRGFVKGDVLISVNGFPVHNKAGAINYFKEHPDEGQYVVEYERLGKQLTKTFVAPKN